MSGYRGSSTVIPAGSGTGTLTLGGILGKGAPAVATTGTSEEILATVTIPASTLATNGGIIRFGLVAHTSAANNKTLRVRIGGIGGTIVWATSTTAFNNQNLVAISCYIQRLSATTGTAAGRAVYSPDGVAAVATGANENDLRTFNATWANSNDLVFTGLTPTAAGDLTLDSYWVEVFP